MLFKQMTRMKVHISSRTPHPVLLSQLRWCSRVKTLGGNTQLSSSCGSTHFPGLSTVSLRSQSTSLRKLCTSSLRSRKPHQLTHPAPSHQVLGLAALGIRALGACHLRPRQRSYLSRYLLFACVSWLGRHNVCLVPLFFIRVVTCALFDLHYHALNRKLPWRCIAVHLSRCYH
jgi:hypothetical protein